MPSSTDSMRIRIPIPICQPITHHHISSNTTAIAILDLNLMQHLLVRPLLLTPSRRQQIHQKGKHIKRKYEGDDPFNNRTGVGLFVKCARRKDYGQADFDDDKGEFHPERQAQNAVLTETHAEALVFGADEDGAEDVAGDEEEEETVVQVRVAQGVED